ncbi:MAG: cold shock domain-containing protein, partial [Wenzhouxiangella sp.]|nr:cold shock domain-containing protein [Wenzhouxiangella sp.]
ADMEEKGKVKWFSSDKGYGFITSDSGEDFYFNVQGVKGPDLPSNGDVVRFEKRSGKKGPKALNVRITLRAPPTDTRPADDRISCPSCGKRIVPRIITNQGAPQKSVCPYCAATVKRFWPWSQLLGLVIVALFILVMVVFFDA